MSYFRCYVNLTCDCMCPCSTDSLLICTEKSDKVYMETTVSLEKKIASMLRRKSDRNRIFSTGPAEIELHPDTLEGIISYLNGGMMNPRSQEFGEILIKACGNINRLVGLTETHEAMFATGSGSNAAQAMCSCVRQKDRVALLKSGIYAERLAETLSYVHVPVFVYDSSGGRYPNLEEFERLIKKNQCNVIAMVAGPTGDTVIMPVEKIAAMARRLNIEIIVDTISTFGAEPHLYMHQYGEQFRAITVGLNKALRCGVFGLNGTIVCKKDVMELCSSFK